MNANEKLMDLVSVWLLATRINYIYTKFARNKLLVFLYL